MRPREGNVELVLLGRVAVAIDILDGLPSDEGDMVRPSRTILPSFWCASCVAIGRRWLYA